MYQYKCSQCKEDFSCKTNRERQNHFCTHDCYSKWLREGNGNSSKTVFKKGHVGLMLGKKHSEKAKRKISEYQKTRKHAFGEKSVHWMGGRIYRLGYISIYRPEHPNCNRQGYVPEHRLVVEGVIGRILSKVEVVHHIDKDKTNNSPSNLMLFKNDSEHQKYHAKLRREKNTT